MLLSFYCSGSGSVFSFKNMLHIISLQLGNHPKLCLLETNTCLLDKRGRYPLPEGTTRCVEMMLLSDTICPYFSVIFSLVLVLARGASGCNS